MDLARLICILAVVGGFLVHMKVDARIGQLVMFAGAAGLMVVFGTRSYRAVKARHAVRASSGDDPGSPSS